MERLYEFLPSIVILSVIALVTYTFLNFYLKRLGENVKSVKWLQEEKNQTKISLGVNVPIFIVGGPALEELVFRAPLIVLFNEPSQMAWYFILVLGILFGFIHWFDKLVMFSDIIDAKKSGESESDSVEDEMRRIHMRNKSAQLPYRVFRIIGISLGGIALGYLGVQYQSIWLVYGIHVAWNVFFLVIVPFLLPIIWFITFVVWENIRTWWCRE